MTLTVTLDLSPTQEKSLRFGIANHDKVHVRQLLVDALEPTIVSLMSETEFNPLNQEFLEISEKLWQEVNARLPADFQPLSDYAVSREGIYGDHP
jgi:antitoxin ParD1/3/4